MSQEVMLVAGEASGDLAASIMLNEIKQAQPQLRFFGVAGKYCADAGLELIFDCKDIAVTGFIEVLQQLGNINRALTLCQQQLKSRRPLCLVLVDYPGFNLKLAKYAKGLNIPVFYYISPKIWAWRKNRIKLLQQYVSHMALIFPFEKSIFDKANIANTVVSHPSLVMSKASVNKATICKKFSLRQDKTIICLMPGSRMSEIKRHMPLFCDVIEQYNESHQFILPVASTISISDITSRITAKASAKITVAVDNRYDIIAASDLVITASGTAALEVALLKKPMCVVYKTSFISAFIARRVLTIDYVSLPNLIVSKEVVPEFLQQAATADNICAWINSILTDNVLRQAMQSGLLQVRSELSGNDITVSDCLLRYLNNSLLT